MENEALSRISDFLFKHNANIDTIPKARLKQFLKVDEVIQTKLILIKDANEILKGRPINIAVIAAESGIARKTFYNNELLGQYVEMYSDSVMSEKAANLADLESLQAKCKELTEQLNQLYQRDIRTQEIMHENIKLQDEIRNLQKRNSALEAQCEQLRARMENTVSPSRGGKIISLKPVNQNQQGE